MPQINQLPTRTPVAGDLVPFFSSNNGDAAKTSFTAIATLITNLMGVSGGGGFITQYSAPIATDFTVTVGGVGQSTWLIVTPTTAGFEGTITFPDVATVADQQELIISTTNNILLTYVATGMTVFGAPATLLAGNSLVFKYDLVSKFWYCVSGNTDVAKQSVGCGTIATTTMVIATPETYVVSKFASSSSWNVSDDLEIMTDGAGDSDSQVYFKYTGTETIKALVTFSFSASNDTADASIKAAIGNQSNSDSALWSGEAQPFDADKIVSITVQKLQYLNTDETVRLWVTSDAASTISITKLQASIIQI
jgi:hypothetical protein